MTDCRCSMDGKICCCRDVAREAQVRGDLAWHRTLLQHRDNRIAALEADLREAQASAAASAATARAAVERLQVADELLRAVSRRDRLGCRERVALEDRVDAYLRVRRG